MEEIRKGIEERGPIPFAEFMRMALYHPAHGYYTTHDPVGREGDFVTSPEIHPFFGKALAHQILEMWELMGRGRVTIVELGGGKGRLASQILPVLDERGLLHREYWIVEKRRPAPLEGVRWSEDVDGIEGQGPWIVISNEFFDALPFHRLRVCDEGIKEVYVGWKDGGFCDVLGPPSTTALEEALRGVRPIKGMELEVCLEAMEWMRKIGTSMPEGFVVTIDYGLPERELYSERHMEGTMLCHHRQRVDRDPYRRVGRQDITCHVNFTALAREGREVGLEVVGFTDQGSFLIGLGVLEELSSLGEDDLEGRMALKSLFMPGFGDTFKVLIQQKGLGAVELKGLSFVNRKDRLY